MQGFREFALQIFLKRLNVGIECGVALKFAQLAGFRGNWERKAKRDPRRGGILANQVFATIVQGCSIATLLAVVIRKAQDLVLGVFVIFEALVEYN